jgi:hypothetical protein
MDQDGQVVIDGTAWKVFCERLETIGARILEADFPSSARERSDGFWHLAEQVVHWLGWSVGYMDPTSPAFYRHADLITKWAGPNADTVYRRARISSEGTYRISGKMHSCEDFILHIQEGDMHMEKYGVFDEVMASELGIGPGDDFELTLSAVPQPGIWIPLDSNAWIVSVREYYTEWRPLEPAVFAIERVDQAGQSRPPVSPQEMGAMLDNAATNIERSLLYWNDYMRTTRDESDDNVLRTPYKIAGAPPKIIYGHCYYDLDDNECLLIESDVPEAHYWSYQLYNLAWFDTLDFGSRITSLNHRQIVQDADGRCRIVVAHRDPGVANWLDTEGLPAAMVCYRWISPSFVPTATSKVVNLSDLRSHLPADTRYLDEAARTEQIKTRQAHLAWRYRT